MKKFLVLALLGLSINTQAATSGTLILTGNIPKKIEIVVTPKPAATNLDLETTQSDLSVATLTGKSNVLAGYKISVASANSGKLIHTSAPTQFVNYTMKLDSTSVPLTGAGFINYTGMGNYTKDVNISYTGVDGFTMQDGVYNDTLTFTITAN